jgi:hypothetical protein
MLCEIALDPRVELHNMNRSDLYDAFVHQILARELAKPARYQYFGVDIRRKFNRSVAWWLWEKGGASTSTLADLPGSICTTSVGKVSHSFDLEGLKRELVAGCLVEKLGGGVFFPHRSIQEFLVSEYFWDEILPTGMLNFDAIIATCTPDVTEFLVGRIEQERRAGSNLSAKVTNLLNSLQQIQARKVSKAQVWPFYVICRASGAVIKPNVEGSPLRFMLGFFVANDEITFEIKKPKSRKYMVDSLRNLSRPGDLTVQTVVSLWCQVVLSNEKTLKDDVVNFLFNLVALNELVAVIEQSLKSEGKLYFSRWQLPFKLWLFFRCVCVRFVNDELSMIFDASEMLSVVKESRSPDFEDIGWTKGVALDRAVLRCSVESVCKRLYDERADSPSAKKVARFFKDEAINRRVTTI